MRRGGRDAKGEVALAKGGASRDGRFDAGDGIGEPSSETSVIYPVSGMGSDLWR